MGSVFVFALAVDRSVYGDYGVDYGGYGSVGNVIRGDVMGGFGWEVYGI